AAEPRVRPGDRASARWATVLEESAESEGGIPGLGPSAGQAQPRLRIGQLPALQTGEAGLEERPAVSARKDRQTVQAPIHRRAGLEVRDSLLEDDFLVAPIESSGAQRPGRNPLEETQSGHQRSRSRSRCAIEIAWRDGYVAKSPRSVRCEELLPELVAQRSER